ncbi:unnamed protein product [Soboliphyme baturini]|uniref:PDZ domain-containing protein n=1 Tax=Soboliphyme baturini TaxID=241478 RepID=A0A3P8A7Q9_9BILA|nr:unnamed protein product [Soboliphyme baturini]
MFRVFPKYYRSPYISSGSLEYDGLLYDDTSSKTGGSNPSISSAISCPPVNIFAGFDKAETSSASSMESPRFVPKNSFTRSSTLAAANSSPSKNLGCSAVAAEFELTSGSVSCSTMMYFPESARAECSSLPLKPQIQLLLHRRTARPDPTALHRRTSHEPLSSPLSSALRTIKIFKEAGNFLGISIVGGNIEVSRGSVESPLKISGIFVKNVIPNSPAGRTGEIRIGDRIIDVNGIDLTNSSHEACVQIIRNAQNPVTLTVQSFNFFLVSSFCN